MNQIYASGSDPSNYKFQTIQNLRCAAGMEFSDGQQIKTIICAASGMWIWIVEICIGNRKVISNPFISTKNIIDCK